MNDSLLPSRRLAIAMALCVLIFIFPPVVDILGEEHSPLEWRLFRFVMALLSMGVFCLNYFMLVPDMLGRPERKARLILINLIVIFGACSILPFATFAVGLLPRGIETPDASMSWTVWAKGFLFFTMRDGIMMILAAALAYALRTGELRETLRRRGLELTAERRQLELSSLRAQLNPHFLFNSLNSIYALIGLSPERARSALHDLSGMLRFMIHDASSPAVPLEREISFVADYVRLQSLRLDSAVEVDVKLPARTECGTLEIAPLIFLTLVENVFKHRAPSEAGDFIKILISIDNDKVVCRVANTYAAEDTYSDSRKKSQGIGLPNISRQLELLYPGSYSCTRCRDNGVYTVELTIDASVLAPAGVR